MNKLFNNILVPVDFSVASEFAIEKAIDIANHFRCNVHLLTAGNGRVINQAHTSKTNTSGDAAAGETRLLQLKNKYLSQLEPGLSMYTAVRVSSNNRAVTEYIAVQQIDLVILGTRISLLSKIFGTGYNLSHISRRVDCPVLSVRKDAGHERWMNIVLPVCSMLPIRKIMFASYLGRKYNSRIHLLSIAGDEINDNPERNEYLYKAYQLLRDNTRLTIECHTIRGHNIADTTLRFAQKINADLIVVNPGNESRLSGFFNRALNGNIFNESRIPVMTVSAL